MNKIKILAPAGNFSCLEAGIKAGAAEVYLGLKEFSARKNADNFSVSELYKAVEYAKKYNVKVFLALNTLVFEREKELFLNCAKVGIEAGISAVIIQDVGAALLLLEKYPDINLHASTQLSISSESGLDAVKKFGFKRVVLARELSLERVLELAKYSTALKLETEIFIYGARCVCLSGQCFISAFFGGKKIRSANRGACAGPCRLAFSSNKKSDEKLLSMPDNDFFKNSFKLLTSSITSLKIEGRMRSPSYVNTAVKTVKRALDCP